ncbi:MAG TPA: hypothetical protein VFC16_18750 [Nakamurella sp.]|nr:hypothetical protein [Nakamurella sp.]
MDQERRAHTADVQRLTDEAARATADAAEQRALVDAAQQQAADARTEDAAMTVELAAARQRVDDERSHARDPALPTDAPATDRLTELRNRETLRAETWDAAPTSGLRGLIRGQGVKGIVVVSGRGVGSPAVVGAVGRSAQRRR